MLLKSVALFLAIAATPASAAPRSPWADLAERDLAEVHVTIAQDHPGPVDDQNPAFKRWLTAGYTEAKRNAARARSLEDVQATLQRYLAGFGDGHLGVSFDHARWSLPWAGLVPSRQGSRTVIVKTARSWEGELPPEGSELVSCDGRRPEDIVRADILPWTDARPELDAIVSRHTRYLFVDDPLIRRPRLRSCVVRDPRGQEREVPLTWHSSSARSIDSELSVSGWGPSPPAGIESLGRNRYWVTFSISFPPTQQEEKAIRAMIDELPKLRGADLIVYDVRGNNGGSSEWGDQMAKALFTSEYIRYVLRREGPDSSAHFRVSPGNLRHLVEVALQVRDKFGPTSAVDQTFAETLAAMRRALQSKETFVQQARSRAGAKESVAAARSNPVKGTVIFLTNGRCGSACLDFADTILSVPGVLHVGQETGADTVYMEARSKPLPSGLGDFYFPTKVYRNRRRGHNQAYRPQHLFTGSMQD